MAGNLLARSVRDLAAGALFGGSLTGAIVLNGVTAEAKDPAERTHLSSLRWAKWAPVQAGAFAAHALAVIAGNKERMTGQAGFTWLTVLKTAVTGLRAAA